MIHFFNPGHETAVCNASPYYMAPGNVTALQHELAYLPAWYAGENDLVLVSGSCDKDYYGFLARYFPALPRAITEEELPDFHSHEVCPWGISPQVIHYFKTLNKKYNINLLLPQWHSDYTYLNSRQSARDCLSAVQKQMPEVEHSLIPEFCQSLDEIEQMIKEPTNRFLAKAPYSSSGRGLLWLPSGLLPQSERQILRGILKKQGKVSIEKALDKQVDFAMEFMCDGLGGIVFEGYSLFSTNDKGAYKGNDLRGQPSIEKILASKIGLPVLEKLKGCLKSELSLRYARHYKGCLGVDMMIYNENGKYKLHPCVEINMRYNMGYLSLNFIQNFLAERSVGYYRTDYAATSKTQYDLHCQMAEKYPPHFKNGKIVSGYLPLCRITENNRYRAYVLIGEQRE